MPSADGGTQQVVLQNMIIASHLGSLMIYKDIRRIIGAMDLINSIYATSLG